MATYYEVLKVRPDASVSEIEVALDAQYNYWRRLVTHHEPEVASQANESLRAIEVIRTTLTDATRRSTYDEVIGLAGIVGGLTDPGIVAQDSTTTTLGSRPPIALDHSQLKTSGSISSASRVGETLDFERRLAAEEARSRKSQAIDSSLRQAEAHLTAKQYRLVRDALVGFEGLATDKGNTSVICRRDDPQWLAAQALTQRGDDMPGKLTLQMLPFTVIAYAVVGYFLLAVAATNFNVVWLYDPALRVVIGAALGAAGPWLYYWKWGGRSSAIQDRVIAALVPLGLGFVLTIGIIIVIIVIALFVLSLFAGSG